MITKSVKKIIFLFFLALILTSIQGSTNAFAGFSVIVNPDSGISSISANKVKKIFLKKIKTLPNGSKAIPVDQKKGSAIRDEFNKKILNKNENQLESYWSRRIFTGRGTPPDEKNDVKSFVANNSSAIGYIDTSKVDSSVKVLFTIK